MSHTDEMSSLSKHTEHLLRIIDEQGVRTVQPQTCVESSPRE